MLSWLSCIPTGYIFGNGYKKNLEFLRSSESWSRQQLCDYQFGKLVDTVEFAATTTPYYRDIFRKHAIPKRIKSIEDFERIPYIDKNDVRDAGDAIFSEAVSKNKRYMVSTGGTSGSQLSLMMSNEAYAIEWSFVHNYLERYAINTNDRKISLRGVPIKHGSREVYSKYNPIYHEMQISPFHLTETVMAKLKDKVKNFNPQYLHGYPSSLILFARLLKKIGLNKKMRLKGVLAISESLFDYQRDEIEQIFNCPVFTFYGHTERLLFAGDAPESRELSLDPRYGYAELKGSELVGTGFINKATLY